VNSSHEHRIIQSIDAAHAKFGSFRNLRIPVTPVEVRLAGHPLFRGQGAITIHETGPTVAASAGKRK